MKELQVKIHVSRDFSYAEFDVLCDPLTGEGLPKAEDLRRIYDMLPEKNTQPIGANGLRQTPESAQRNEEKDGQKRRRNDPPATANQRRVLERYGEWRDGLTKSEASDILQDLGF